MVILYVVKISRPIFKAIIMNKFIVISLIQLIGQYISSVLCVLEAETLQLDVRNELDMITKDLVTRGFVENNGYHAYIYESGIGNREELKITSFSRNNAFIFGHGVKEWQTIASDGNILMLGRTPEGIILTVTSQKHSNKSISGSTQTIELPTSTVVTASSMFERWNHSRETMDIIIVIAVNSSTSDLHWYSFNKNKLEKFWSWSRYKPVSCMVIFKIGKHLNLITINNAEKGQPTTADVYDIALLKLDFRLSQSLPLDESSSSVNIGVIGKDTYLFIPQTKQGILLVFKYEYLSGDDSNGYFQHNINITSTGVTQSHFFTTASQSYLAVNGESPNIYRIKYSGGFVKDLDMYLNKVEDWLIIPVHTYRSEVVILAKQKEDIKLLVWKGVDKGFSEGLLPPCDTILENNSSCLEGMFSGAIAVSFYNSPSILLPTKSNYSVLYHVITSLNEVKDPMSSEIFQLSERRIFIQDIWNRQKIAGKEMSAKIKHAIKTNETNIISAKWVVESLETPILIDSGKVTYSETVSSKTSSMSDDMAINTLKEKIVKASNEIDALKVELEEVASFNWDLSTFSGKLIVKGIVSIQNLTLTKINNKDVNKILHDSLRWDKPKKISGIKTVPLVKADSLTFNKVNNFTASQLSYADGPVSLSGNVTFLERLTVQDQVVLPDEGLVNGIDFSEEVCRVEKSCPATLKFEKLTVENRITAEKVNNEVPEINISEAPSTWATVYSGNGLKVAYINGKNWADIVTRVVYTDGSEYIPETTVIKGTVFSENDIKLKNLIDRSAESQYIPFYRLAENETESIDNTTFNIKFKNRQSNKKPAAGQDNTDNPAAAIRNQKIGMETLLKDNLIDADVIFTNVEVLGKVSSDETLDSNSWADDMADVILNNETEVSISGSKYFNNTLDVKKDFQVKGLVGGVNLSQVLTTDTDQILNGVRIFHGNVTFDNIILSGDWNGVNLTKLDSESVKLSADQFLPLLHLVFNETSVNINAKNLTIAQSINNISVTDIIKVRKIREGFEFSSLSAKNLTVLQNVVASGKVCGWNLKELDEQRFSLTRDQNITGNFSFDEVDILDELQVKKVNGLNISNINSALNTYVSSFDYSDLIISELHVEGNIDTSEGVGEYDLKAIAKDAILLTGNNNIKTQLVFEDLLTCEMLDVHNTVGGQNWTRFTQDVVYKNETYVVFQGEKTFLSGFHLTGDLEVEEINGHRIEEILTTTTPQNITGEVRILGDLVVDKNIHLLETLNEINISKLASRCHIPERTNSIICNGDANFEQVVHLNDLYIGKSINGINFNNLASSIVYRNSTSVINGKKKFTGDVTFTDLTVSTLNGVDFNHYLEDIVLMEPEVEITKHITFVEDVTVMENVVVEYNLEVPTVSSYNLQEWAANAVYLDRNMTVTGIKQFKSSSSNGNITTHYYGNLDMLGGGIILLNKEQALTGTLKFDHLTVFKDVPVGRKVNNIRLDELFENTLRTDWDQIVESEIKFTEEIIIEGNLTTLGNVNKKDLKKVVTLHSNQTLSGNYIFDCLAATNDANLTDLISGINITDWRQRAVMLNTDEEINGYWNVNGDINFTHTVNGLDNLGEVNLNELTRQIQTHILDVELEMKENLTSLCNDTNILINKARQVRMSLLYFEVAQQINVATKSYKPHYFQAYGENYLFISKKNCSCDLYKWNKNTEQFYFVQREKLSFFIRWVTIQHNELVFVISLSDETSTCDYQGVNLWLFTNTSLQYIKPLQFSVTDLTSEGLQNIFYTVESSTVKQWFFKVDEEGMISITQGREWIIVTIDNIRFLEANSGLGLVVTNGTHLIPLQPLTILPDNLKHHFGKEIAFNYDQGFLAVSSWEDSEIKRHLDFVKIYRSNGLLYDKLLARRPSQLNWFKLQDTIWLAFIENSTTLQVYQHQGVFQGFQLKLSKNLQSSGLLSIMLPVVGKWNEHPYLILFSNKSIQLIESKIVGDPYSGSDLACNFRESMSRLKR